jgi:hypothetical protein
MRADFSGRIGAVHQVQRRDDMLAGNFKVSQIHIV